MLTPFWAVSFGVNGLDVSSEYCIPSSGPPFSGLKLASAYPLSRVLAMELSTSHASSERKITCRPPSCKLPMCCTRRRISAPNFTFPVPAGRPATGSDGHRRRPLTGPLARDDGQPADAGAGHVRLQRLVDLHRLDQVRWNDVQFDLTHRLRRRNIHTVDRHVGQPRLRAPYLDILSLTLIALQRHTRQSPDRIGHVGIRQALDHVGRQHINDVVRIERPVDRFDLSALPARIYLDVLFARCHAERRLQPRSLSCHHPYLLRELIESR